MTPAPHCSLPLLLIVRIIVILLSAVRMCKQEEQVNWSLNTCFYVNPLVFIQSRLTVFIFIYSLGCVFLFRSGGSEVIFFSSATWFFVRFFMLYLFYDVARAAVSTPALARNVFRIGIIWELVMFEFMLIIVYFAILAYASWEQLGFRLRKQ